MPTGARIGAWLYYLLISNYTSTTQSAIYKFTYVGTLSTYFVIRHNNNNNKKKKKKNNNNNNNF